MSTSDTPRTDAARGFDGMYTAVDADEMEKLERELNETKGAVILKGAACATLREQRDELRVQLAEAQEQEVQTRKAYLTAMLREKDANANNAPLREALEQIFKWWDMHDGHLITHFHTPVYKRMEGLRAALAPSAQPAENTDTARLDWLDKNGRKVSHAIGYRGDPDSWFFVDKHSSHNDAANLRAAIDAAMASAQPEVKE